MRQKIEPNLEQLKFTYLSKVEDELKTNFPLQIPSLLLSLFSQNLIKDPVISSYGRVYDKKEIEKWLETHNTDELRTPLTVEMLYPFPELIALINEFRTASDEFISRRNSLLNLARKMAASSSEEMPEIFICPISRKLIINPVISNLGVIYDEISFANLTQKTDEKVVPFTEFAQYLNFYQWKLKKDRQNPSNKKEFIHNQSKFDLFINYLSTFFPSKEKVSETEEESFNSTPQ